MQVNKASSKQSAENNSLVSNFQNIQGVPASDRLCYWVVMVMRGLGLDGEWLVTMIPFKARLLPDRHRSPPLLRKTS